MEFFISASFFSVFFSTSFCLIILWSNLDGSGRTQFLCFPFWQSNFIKLFDGGLQYVVIRTFIYHYGLVVTAYHHNENPKRPLIIKETFWQMRTSQLVSYWFCVVYMHSVQDQKITYKGLLPIIYPIIYLNGLLCWRLDNLTRKSYWFICRFTNDAWYFSM